MTQVHLRVQISRLKSWRVTFLSAFLCALIHLAVPSGAAAAETLRVAGYNVESGGADPTVVAKRIAEVQADACDIWGFSEVHDKSWADRFEKAIEQAAGPGADFAQVGGTTGHSDRLWIIYDARRFDLVRSEELNDMNIGGRVRAPLVADLRFRNGGGEFLFMVNHLYRGNNAGRWDQARMLHDWATKQTLPIVAVGDYNFDWNAERGDTDHDKGYDNFTAGGVFRWIRPDHLVKTQDSNYNSVLDFVFCSQTANDWSGVSRILQKDGDFPNDRTTSDHRPVWAELTVPDGPGAMAGARRPAEPAATPTSHPADRVEPASPDDPVLANIQRLRKTIDELEKTLAALRLELDAMEKSHRERHPSEPRP